MDSFESLLQLSPPVILPFFIKYMISGLTMSFRIPPRLVPMIGITLGGVVYPFIAKTGDVSFSVHYPVVLNVIVGACIGGAASGVHTMIKSTSSTPPNEPYDEEKNP